MSKQVGGPRQLSLDEVLLPVDENVQPLWVCFETDPDSVFIPLFTTEEKMKVALDLVGLKPHSVKKITDGSDFLVSIPAAMNGLRIRIALDIHQVEGGKQRWTEVLRD